MTKDRPRNRPKSRGETGASDRLSHSGVRSGAASGDHSRPERKAGQKPGWKAGSKPGWKAGGARFGDGEQGGGKPRKPDAAQRHNAAPGSSDARTTGDDAPRDRQKPWTHKRTPQHASRKPPRANAARYGERRASFEEGDEVWIWGLHAVAAALANPARRISLALITRNAAQRMGLDAAALPAFVRTVEPSEVDLALPADAVHQGAAIRTQPLPEFDIDAFVLQPEKPIVILDQVTDPQNVGAIFRSAAAFGFAGVVLQTRNAPALGGALAKAATGAIETLAEIRTVNISRAIAALADAGWNIVGLDGAAEVALDEAFSGPRPLAVVLGAEGAGLRPGVASACTQLARIPMDPAMESLNVSNAAAIAFYQASRRN